MRKSDIAVYVAKRASLSKVQSERAVIAFLQAIRGALVNEESISLPEFSTFSMRSRSERIGRNHHKGESIVIAASKVSPLRVGKTLRETVRQRSAGLGRSVNRPKAPRRI